MFSIAPDHADVDVGVEEHRVLGGDDDVGVDDEVQPGPGDHPVDGRHRRLPHPVLARRPVHLVGTAGPCRPTTPPRDATAPTSAPVEKKRSPVAVTTLHRIHGSSRTSAQIALIGSTIEECSVLARSGRLIVM